VYCFDAAAYSPASYLLITLINVPDFSPGILLASIVDGLSGGRFALYEKTLSICTCHTCGQRFSI
jgi:hypothetical protein